MIGEYKVVALCVSRIQENFTHDFIMIFSEVLNRAGYRLFVYNACTDLSLEESKAGGQRYTYDLIDFSVIDALVVYEDRIRNKSISDGIIANGLKHKVPVIVLGEPHPGCVCIASDDSLGMKKMVRHLIADHGVRDLHFVAGIQGERYSEERVSAFKSVLAEYNMPFEDSMLSYGEYWAGPTEAVVERLIAEDKLPEAFVCVNDHTALSVCGVLKNHGIQIPQEVKVTGFDGLFDTKVSSPTVSTVNCSIREYAEQTLRAVQSAFSGTWEEKTILFEPELWQFESCGCNGQKTLNAAEYIIELKDSLYRFYTDNQEMLEVSAKLQRSESPLQLAAELVHPQLMEFCCVIEKRFLNRETALSDEAEEGKKKEHILLYDGLSTERSAFVPASYQVENICPNIEELLAEQRTLVFSALSYLDVPMGYLCFYFRELKTSALLFTPQVSNFVGMGIGGYVNLRHEHYLNEKIEKMYRVDSLTGLYNRRGFALEYQKMLSSLTTADKLTVALADVDSLKKVNDKYGHAAGDVAICTAAAALRYACPEGALCVRFGGDEMLAVCPGGQDTSQMRTRFYEYLSRVNQSAEYNFDVNASIGIYITEAGEEPGFEELVIHSDRLMYMEKEKRKREMEPDT